MLVETVSLFSKTARGNHRDDGLRDWTDEEIAGALGGLTRQLTKEQKVIKQRLMLNRNLVSKEMKERMERQIQNSFDSKEAIDLLLYY